MVKKCVAVDGVPSPEELASCPGVPDEKRLDEGPVAVIECFQEIPCNPCEPACPHGAITVGEPITRLPVLDQEKCTGCGVCIPHCPGLAIFVVSKKGERALIRIPYEYRPLPRKEQQVDVVNRAGQVVGKGEICSLQDSKKNDKTVIVGVLVEKGLAGEVRGIRL